HFAWPAGLRRWQDGKLGKGQSNSESEVSSDAHAAQAVEDGGRVWREEGPAIARPSQSGAQA
ncbi:MAG: hypothetical protein KJZ87_21510, partial [Thermoguttaceae bacterium]|nr:hypothetical protein [Thermoguttaceae bacterium]